MRTPLLHKITIIGKLPDKANLINKLQRAGLLHIATPKPKDGFAVSLVPQRIAKISKLLLKLSYIAQQTKFEVDFSLRDLPPIEELLEEADQFTKKYFLKAKQLEKEALKLNEELQLKNSQASLLLSIPFSVQKPSASNLDILLYESNKAVSFAKLRKKKRFVLRVKTVEKKYYYIFEAKRETLVQLKEELEKTQLKRIDVDFIKENTRKTQKTINEDTEKIQESLVEIKTKQTRLLDLEQGRFPYFVVTLENYHAQLETSSKLLSSKKFFLLEGYIEKKHFAQIQELTDQASIIVEKATKAPTKLDNKKINKHFEPITELFGIPSYRSVDPTPLVTFFYPLFFGFMLSDIGYGLVLLALITAARVMLGEKLHSIFVIFSLSALSSILFGLIFGSFFGNLAPITPLYQDSFSASFTILKISLAIGLIHLNIGQAINVYQLKNQKLPLKKIFLEASPFYLIQLVALTLFLQQYYIGSILAILLITILLKEKSLFGLMDITNFFGTLFSYARLLALSLATAGVALAINIIAQSLLELGKFGVILWVLVLLVGHAFNFALNILGCSIHAARLHYVEFFSLFFKGEGEKFIPFNIKKTYGGIQW